MNEHHFARRKRWDSRKRLIGYSGRFGKPYKRSSLGSYNVRRWAFLVEGRLGEVSSSQVGRVWVADVGGEVGGYG